ncbi:uncharacterized protein LOC143174564 isoform X3 [Nomia melanderi]
MCNKEAMVAHFWNKEETNLVSSDTLMKICQPKGRRMKTGCIEETGTRPEDALFKRSSEVKEARSKLFPEGRGIKGPEKPGNEFPRNVRLQDSQTASSSRFAVERVEVSCDRSRE